MKWFELNKSYLVLFVIFLSGIYGCSYKGTEVEEKPPYAHGHIEEEPPPRHQVMHKQKEPAKAESDMLVIMGAFPTGDPHSSVILVETMVPRMGQVNQPYEYLIKVTNLTQVPVRDVEVVQTLSEKFQIKKSDPEMQKPLKEGVAKWLIGDINSKETKVIRVTGVPTTEGEIPFCTTATYNLPEFCVTPVIVQPKLSLAKRMPSEVLICDPIPVTLIISNTGTGVAQDVQIKESLPSGLTTADGKASIMQTIGSLQPKESREVSLTLKAEKTGQYTNVATASGVGGLSAESNSTTVIVKQPILAIEKTGPEKRYVGRKITYDIEVSNEGDGQAASTVIEDTIPANASFVSASNGGTFAGNTVKWNVGTLQPKDSEKVSVTLRAESIGKAENKAVAKAVCAEAVSTSAVTQILGIPAILLEVIDVEDPVAVGDSVTYVITVTNQGSDTSTNTEITCTLEDTMQYVSSTGPTKAIVEGKEVSFGPLPTLAPKAQASWKLIVKAVDEGDVRLKVSLMEDCLERPVEETEATNFYQ
ncbi:MAG: DUF11 domain-containing protein [Candidatus Jettenia caeni]|nr:DUF11 domain-containing protein [Candidatus Jettenia caeni]